MISGTSRAAFPELRLLQPRTQGLISAPRHAPATLRKYFRSGAGANLVPRALSERGRAGAEIRPWVRGWAGAWLGAEIRPWERGCVYWATHKIMTRFGLIWLGRNFP